MWRVTGASPRPGRLRHDGSRLVGTRHVPSFAQRIRALPGQPLRRPLRARDRAAGSRRLSVSGHWRCGWKKRSSKSLWAAKSSYIRLPTAWCRCRTSDSCPASATHHSGAVVLESSSPDSDSRAIAMATGPARYRSPPSARPLPAPASDGDTRPWPAARPPSASAARRPFPFAGTDRPVRRTRHTAAARSTNGSSAPASCTRWRPAPPRIVRDAHRRCKPRRRSAAAGHRAGAKTRSGRPARLQQIQRIGKAAAERFVAGHGHVQRPRRIAAPTTGPARTPAMEQSASGLRVAICRMRSSFRCCASSCPSARHSVTSGRPPGGIASICREARTPSASPRRALARAPQAWSASGKLRPRRARRPR